MNLVLRNVTRKKLFVELPSRLVKRQKHEQKPDEKERGKKLRKENEDKEEGEKREQEQEQEHEQEKVQEKMQEREQDSDSEPEVADTCYVAGSSIRLVHMPNSVNIQSHLKAYQQRIEKVKVCAGGRHRLFTLSHVSLTTHSLPCTQKRSVPSKIRDKVVASSVAGGEGEGPGARKKAEEIHMPYLELEAENEDEEEGNEEGDEEEMVYDVENEEEESG
jgi:hypothetical protein